MGGRGQKSSTVSSAFAGQSAQQSAQVLKSAGVAFIAPFDKGFDDEVLAVAADELKRLEDRYGALGDTRLGATLLTVSDLGQDGGGALTRTLTQEWNGRTTEYVQELSLSPSAIGTMEAASRYMADHPDLFGDFRQTPENVVRYVVAHEYGHVVASQIGNRRGVGSSTVAARAMDDIMSKNGWASVVSLYGANDGSEFFAEAFAAMEVGNKGNYFGREMAEWIAKNG